MASGIGPFSVSSFFAFNFASARAQIGLDPGYRL